MPPDALLPLPEIDEVVSRALEALGPNPIVGTGVKTASFDVGSQRDPWVVCRGAQNANKAELLDRTVTHARANKARYALSILDPPNPMLARAALPADDYRYRYQGAAWYGLHVVCVTGNALQNWHPTPAPDRGNFDDIADAVTSRLEAVERTHWVVEDSPEAEGLVRPFVHEVLEGFGFRRDLPDKKSKTGGKKFQGFWRRGESDGMWLRDGESPGRIALEVKWREDADAPFSQVVDDLGAADAVIQVRLFTGDPRKATDAAEELAAFERRMPVRYIRIASTS